MSGKATASGAIESSHLGVRRSALAGQDVLESRLVNLLSVSLIYTSYKATGSRLSPNVD